jgi:hypothetical protein
MYPAEVFSQGICRMAQGSWYIGREGKQLGPYRYDSVRLAATNGKLRADDLLWTESMAEWTRADTIPDVAQFLPKKPGPQAASSPAITASLATESQSAPPVSEKKSAAKVNYLLRHWRGDFSLPQSYWINSVLVSMLWYLLTLAITTSGFTQNLDIRESGFWALSVMSVWVAIGLWSAIGVWHSADKHVARGGTPGWARTAKVLMAIGLLRLVESALQSAPIIHQSLSLAAGHDTMPASQLRVLNRATEVEIAGGLSFGTANSLKTILDATPTIRLVQLNNTGGWIDEGSKLAALVQARKLATYTARECDSACLLVFLAGTDRYLGSSGKLGFHEASVAGQGGEAAKSGTQEFRDALQLKGAPEEFISKALSTPPDSMWYPTAQELLDAHVITAIVDEQKFGETGIESWKDRLKLEREFAAVPLFAAVAQAQPAVYKRLKESYVSGVQSGLPQSELTAQVRTAIIGTVLPKYLAQGAAVPLIAYWQSQVQEMSELRAPDARNCVAFMYPQNNEPAQRAHISEAARSADIAALTALLSAPLDSTPMPSEASVQPALIKAAQRTEKLDPGALQLFAKGDRSSTHPRELCDAAIHFYGAIFALPPQEAAPLLKYMLTQK